MKRHVYVETFDTVDGPVWLLHETGWLFGFVMFHVTAPVGLRAPATPETVVVRVVLPPSVGFDDATTKIPGNCFAKVNVLVELVTAT